MKLDNISGSIPDDRDYPYVKRPGPFIAQLDLKPDVFEIEDQGSVGSCTCNSSVSACEDLYKQDLSRLYPYWYTRNVVEDRPGQEGASLRDALRALYHYGTPIETLWPYDVAQVNIPPPGELATQAQKVTRYEKVDHTDLNAVKSALNEGLPVIFAARVNSGIFNLTGPWQTHKYPPTKWGTIQNGLEWKGNHAILCIGYDDTIKNPCPGWIMSGSFLIQNSWGAQYGDGGFFGMPYQTWLLDVFEAWVIRGFADINPPKYVTPPSVVLGWYKSVWRVDVTDPTDPNVQYWANHEGGEAAFLQCYKDIVDGIIRKRLNDLTIT